jgi:tetratricopeptide (TPR) repeat protein
VNTFAATHSFALPTTIAELLTLAYSNWDNAELLGRIGTELESRSRLEAARDVLGRALELAPFAHPEWYLSLAFAHFRDVSNISGEGERILIDAIEDTDSDFLKAAYLSVLEGDTGADEGIADLIEYLAESNNLSVRFALGHSLLWRGDAETSLVMLREAIAALPDDTSNDAASLAVPLGLDMYCGAMNWMRGQGHDIDLRSEVLPVLRRLIAAHPHVYNYRALTIQLFQTLRDYAAVRDTAHETLAVFPDEETTMVALASAYEKLGSDALQNTSDSQTYSQMAVLWYNRAIGAKPSYARARQMLGRLYERRGELVLAEQVFREIPIAFPAYTLGRLELSYFLHRTGRTSEALSLFRYGYDHLKTFEKSGVEQHPEGKMLLAELNKFSLPILA